MAEVTLADEIGSLVSAARALFPDLEYVAPSGVLSIDSTLYGVQRVRLEAAGEAPVLLQSLSVLTSSGPVRKASGATASGWTSAEEKKLDVKALLDFDSPKGTLVRAAAAEGGSWFELDLGHRTDVTGLRLRNIASRDAARATGLRVRAQVADTWITVWDHATRVAELRRVLTERGRHGGSEQAAALAPLIAQALGGEYVEARRGLEAMTELDPADGKAFRGAMTRGLLAERSLEWTIHGPQRCFRFWSEPEKATYTASAAEVAEALSTLTPQVCFGFGAALCVVRDGDFIPHDDDLDIIIAFEPHEADSLLAGLKLVEEHLRAQGFTVSGNFSAHRHVKRGKAKHVDVFVGLYEGDSISWYPGTRGALDRATMFPVSQGSLHGVTVPLPRNPLLYLERLYGKGWRHPDPDFRHTWDRSTYADIAR